MKDKERYSALDQGCPTLWPAMLSPVACVEIKVAEKLYRRPQRAFLFNLLVLIRASTCIYIFVYSFLL